MPDPFIALIRLWFQKKSKRAEEGMESMTRRFSQPTTAALFLFIVLLGTLVISGNFLLEFYWLSLTYKKLNYIASYIYNIYLIMSIINVINTVKGNSNYYHILILFAPQPCRYVN